MYVAIFLMISGAHMNVLFIVKVKIFFLADYWA